MRQPSAKPSPSFSNLIPQSERSSQNITACPVTVTNATDFFGTDATCPAGSTTITGTCNGNGDGIVSINLNAGGHPTEDSYALNQLYFAGLIAGKYPAGPGSNSCCKTLVMGTRVPVSVYSPNIGYQLATMPTSNFLAQNIPAPAKKQTGNFNRRNKHHLAGFIVRRRHDRPGCHED